MRRTYLSVVKTQLGSCAATLYFLQESMKEHFVWKNLHIIKRGQDPDGPLLGFKPETFGMLGAVTTAEPQTPGTALNDYEGTGIAFVTFFHTF